jgi:quinoprotein relay system zinc metallohydrolase 2
LKRKRIAQSLARRSLLAAASVSICGALRREPALAATPDVSLQEIADGLFVHFGRIALTSRENAGDIANIGIAIGQDSVAVIDSGGSVEVGRHLLAAMRQITSKPIRYVINTHEHPDHMFGNAAFRGATFVGHHHLPASIRTRGPYYMRSFRETLGTEAIGEVDLVPPTLLVEDRMTLDLGGRSLSLIAWPGRAHSDCDMTVVDDITRVLLAGDLVFLDHVPVIDGSIAGWLGLLPRLAEVPATRVVPGHGRRIGDWPVALEDESRYLNVLRKDARRLIAAGVPLGEAVTQIGQSERARWRLFDDYNPRNATTAYSELEWE